MLGQAVRARPRPGAFPALHRLGARYARWALRSRALPLPRAVRTFPERVARLGGGSLEVPPEQLIETRLGFLLVRALLTQVLAGRPFTDRRWLPRIVVEGAGHLEQALEPGRGAVLVTTHFGLPPLIHIVLEDLGVRGIPAGGAVDDATGIVVAGDVWQRARGLHRLRASLSRRGVCVLLPDERVGRCLEIPFLGSRLTIALGPFLLAHLAGCPVLPYFATCAPDATAFRVRIDPALPLGAGGSEAGTAAAAFARLYEDEARRCPEQLLAYEPLLGRPGLEAAPGHPA